MTSDEVVGDGV
jgi:hypothetical protein